MPRNRCQVCDSAKLKRYCRIADLTFLYDDLNRLRSATEAQNTTTQTWKQAFTYDPVRGKPVSGLRFCDVRVVEVLDLGSGERESFARSEFLPGGVAGGG